MYNFNDEKDWFCQYEGDNLDAENNIIECMMMHKKDIWRKFRGGKYTRFDINYKFPNNEFIKDLPLCNCGLPCDIKLNEDENYLYFRCSKKNMWENMKEEFDIDYEPCNFFMKYTKDKELKEKEDKIKKERGKKFKYLYKNSYWLKNVETDNKGYPKKCVGGCNRTSISIKLLYNDNILNLCFDCFIDKNEELSNKYKYNGKCLIEI